MLIELINQWFLPLWAAPTAPVMVMPASHHLMAKAEEEEPDPASTKVVEVKVTTNGSVTVTATPVPAVPEPTSTPVETPDAKWNTLPSIVEKEATAVRKLREARAGAGAASESLDEVINRFRKKSGELLAAQQTEKDKKDKLCLRADPPLFL